MPAFQHSLHAPVIVSELHQKDVAAKLSAISAGRMRAAAQLAPAALAPAAAVTIALSTVSFSKNFDSTIDVRFRGAAAGQFVPLVMDSGNTALVVPSYEDLAALPNFATNYTTLLKDTAEPFQCPANLMRGPIDFQTEAHGTLTIPDCVFYACTGPADRTKRTSNFGLGWISPWPRNGAFVVQAPLSYLPGFPFAEINLVAAPPDPNNPAEPLVTEGSSMILSSTVPAGYRMLEIVRGVDWMSLVPKSLTIGATRTAWPGHLATIPIAMIDTGGGPVFLSDPNGTVYDKPWPHVVQSPWWTKPGSVPCESISDPITVELADAASTYSYTIDTANLPRTVQGLTLVMCRDCEYMRGKDGLNVGGLSMLFNSLLIDYRAGRLGLKAR